MTRTQFEKIKPQILIGNTYSNLPIQEKHFYSYAKDAYDSAKTYFKNQKDFIELGYLDEHVMTAHVFSEYQNELIYMGFKASKNYSFIQWFRICLGTHFLYLNDKQLSKYINHKIN